MAKQKQKQAQLELYIAPQDIERFRALVQTVGQRHATSPLLQPLVMEVLTEEPGQTSLGSPYVKVGVWFDGAYSAYWFALYLREAQQAWQELPAQEAVQVAAEQATYPQFFVDNQRQIHVFYRFSAPNTFVAISHGQLQVRRDQPGQRYSEEGAWRPISEQVFLDAYRDCRQGLRVLAEMEGDTPAQYLHRGGSGDGWFYRFAAAYDPGCHVRLNVCPDEQGVTANLLYSFDTRRGDQRRTPTTEEAFAHQLELVFQEADAAVFGSRQEGEVANG